ncbi:ryanodine receptor 3 [Leptonychotes weddellii]|uniref:Ryanodine receptor 3 n=1 Tax=Leptonychotes weddellii TaxID=9713 RepID=A0A7F8QIH7_LEPWE|nr:ryanodine receptor 3 [Leptonychotes weddellii]
MELRCKDYSVKYSKARDVHLLKVYRGGRCEDRHGLPLQAEDEVVLQCIANIHKEQRKFCLAAEGLGNRLCFLEPTSEAKYVPPDLCVCNFALEQSLSVRALQEMLANTGENGSEGAAQGGGHRTLLYGHAILLRHSFSGMYLTCLTTSRSQTDKLAFDVGLREHATGEACWWTIHPASKQRSEGEKVRIGDDLILVSVSSERYLHLSVSNGNIQVDASFMQTLWNVHPTCSGSSIEEGYLLGGHVVRLFHGHDECLTIPSTDQNDAQHRRIFYEAGGAGTRARSLWRVEPLRISWSGSNIRWGQAFRLRHLTTGHYLALTEDQGLILQDRVKSDTKATAFSFRASKETKEKLDSSHKRDIEGMGVPEIKYGDSVCFVQHIASGLWVTYKAQDAKTSRLGPLKRKVILHQEGHMDDGLTLQRCQREESQAARIIRNTTALFSQFVSGNNRTAAPVTLPIEEVLQTLQDLIAYFQPPEEEMQHEDKQNKLRSLKNRQNLFKEEGMLALVLNCIDRLNIYNSVAHFAGIAREESGMAWKEILNLLYQLLAALIRGNRNNCAQFSNNLDWLISKLDRLESSSGILEVLHCILIESPEALNLIAEGHIKSIISLLDKHGRNHKVLDVLCSLCLCNGVAVRANQNLICDNLLPRRNLLLQTRLINDVTSIRPNIFLGVAEGSAQYKKWYFELIIDQVDPFLTAEPTHLRVGWASSGYAPYPGGGEGWGGNGVGDDLYSYGFDGLHLWSGRIPRAVASINQHLLRSDDVVSCCLDLGVPSISFRINGQPVQGMFENFNTDGLFFPVVSFSAGVKVRFLMGGRHGEFKFLPPSGYAPCYEALLPKEKMRLEPVKEYKRDTEGVRDLLGTTQSLSQASFIPYPIDTSQVVLPPHLEKIRDRLAENIHELWGMNKIELGWTFGKDLKNKRNPRLVPYVLLDERTKKSNRDSLREAVRTFVGYGYNIEPSDQELADPAVEKVSIDKIRFFRVERSYAVRSGKWYFEFEVVTGGDMRVGWARPGCRPDIELGADDQAFVFEGSRGQRWHQGSGYFGRTWQPGDVVGCMINLDDASMIFTLNGELLITNKGSELAFADYEIENGFVPICSLGLSQIGRMNLGMDASTFKFYTMCGLQEGFEPFAVNMNRDMAMWFSKRLPTFVNVPKDHPHIEVVRIDGTMDSPPCLKVTHKTFGTQNSDANMIYCRLSMPVECHSSFSHSPCLDSDAFQKRKQMQEILSHTTTQCYYAIRIFAGQDPSCVWVGWVTPDYHLYSEKFDLNKNCTVTVTLGDERGRVHESVKRSNCYMVWGGDIVATSQRSSRSNVDLEIGCLVDLAMGMLSFSANGRELGTCYQVEPNTKVFPAVFLQPTSTSLFQFELGKLKNAMPLSAAIFKSEEKNPVPQCPPRLDVQTIQPVLWSRMPSSFLKVETERVSERHGWVVQCLEPLQMMALHIPEENRCVDVLELCEQEDLMQFHYHTLRLYSAVCALGNSRVAYALCGHVDLSQLFYAIDNKYLPGLLRSGFYDLLISIHLANAKERKLMMKNEYIIPITSTTRNIRLYPDESKRHGLPGVGLRTCLKPGFRFSTPCFVVTSEEHQKQSPEIPLEILKTKALSMLTEAVQHSGAHIRDPVGGSVEFQFVPVLKLIGTLLVMGVFDDDDVRQILLLIDPSVFGEHSAETEDGAEKEEVTQVEEKAVEAGEKAGKEAPVKGLLQTRLPESVKLQMCELLSHLCDCELQHRVEAIVAFGDIYVSKLQANQKSRYNELMQALNMSAALTARKTREFRSPPQEQINMLLNFQLGENCPCPEEIREELYDFHEDLLIHCGVPLEEEEEVEEDTSWTGKLRALVYKIKGPPKPEKEQPTEEEERSPTTLKELISQTMIRWAQEDQIQDAELVRMMFNLLRRQYDSIGELLQALRKTYTISQVSVSDTINLLAALGQIRCLLSVRMGKEEELLMINGLGDIMNNKVFYQHPNLMRVLGMHETVMEVMVNVLGAEKSQIAFPKMVASCCRFLCYFCRISRQNQKAMFEHLSYLLENSSVGLASPSMRGSTPLDVAASSVMDNNELALGLEEPDLEKVVTYLAGCGLQSCPMLLAKGYPDVGWNPIEGERYLSFLRFAVFVNSESVEENASVVVKLLIRRPECFGPALRGEGGNGLLAAMQGAIKISENPALDLPSQGYKREVLEDSEDEEIVHMGNAIMSFYSALIDLLGRCAPEMHLIQTGKGEAIRIRSILRSLVPTEDLVGIISIPLKVPSLNKDGSVSEPDMAANFCPDHKAPMVLFLDRVYGIKDQTFLLHLLEVGFLPDLRASASLDTVSLSTTEVALALNRYLCSAVLPLLTRCAPLFAGTEHYTSLIDSTLQTIYRLSKGRSLTKAQRDTIEECLLAICNHLRPSMLQQLLRRLVFDVPQLNEYCKMPLKLLTNHYEQCWKYYCLPSGWGSYGLAVEEELHLPEKLFWGIFDSLSHKEKEMEKQKTLYQQARLHERGAAEMVLQMISASKGEMSLMVVETLKLGIAILNGGNAGVQQKMLDYLKEKKDAGFFQSLSGLMQSCSVLDLNAFERQNKAEGLGMVTEEGTLIVRERGEKVLQNDEFTRDLFRFLQLLCEGHNSDFQNFLRTQMGNTTTINIIISTVDYLLRLQESISDFYWYYSGKDIIDESGQHNFSKALAVTKQIFNSLTEYIQGPCIGNQQSLAHSRLWDAVVGFLHVFANMQMKLSQDSSQIELLKELLDLLQDMVVMLLSLLEGNVVNGTIGKQMVDTLVESSTNVEMILKFFDMFLKLKDLTSSDTFKEYDPDGKGIISKKEFQKAMEGQKQYTQSEIDFLLSCAEADENDMFNYIDFVNRFHEPAKDIGFNVAVLLTNLSEHMPNDSRLKCLLDPAESVLNYFEPYLGRIEIMGGAKKIERVYFEISESSRTQWEKPQVKESKRQFIFDVVNEGGEQEKMELFVNFCEDTIFEMQLASQISESDSADRPNEEEEEDEDSSYMLEIEGEEEDAKSFESASAFAMAYASVKRNVANFLKKATLKNLRKQYRKVKKMTVKELVKVFFSFFWMLFVGLFRLFFTILGGIFQILWNTVFGGGLVEGAKNIRVTKILGDMPDPTQFGIHDDALDAERAEVTEPGVPPELIHFVKGDKGDADIMSDLFGFHPKKEGGLKHGPEGGLGDLSEIIGKDEPPTLESTVQKKRKAQAAEMKAAHETEGRMEPEKTDLEDGEKEDTAKEEEQAEALWADMTKKKKRRRGQKVEKPEAFMANFFKGLEIYQTKLLHYLARNFYNLRFLALFVAFAINFILLFYKVTEEPLEEETEDVANLWNSFNDEEEEEAMVFFVLQESTGYMAPTLRALAIVHTIISLLCVVGYYCLKVPLVVFKREKEIARKLEFDGLYITEQPSEDDIKGQWDRLVINTPHTECFPGPGVLRSSDQLLKSSHTAQRFHDSTPLKSSQTGSLVGNRTPAIITW